MLWDPAFAGMIGTRLTAQSGLPALASPVFGVDAGSAATLFTDTAATAQAASGQSVARVNDAFGNATASFQQANSGERPQLLANLAGGRPGLRFNGTTSWLRLQPASGSGALFQGRDFTFCACYRRNQTNSDAGGVFQAGSADGGQGAQGYDMVLVESGPGPALFRSTGSQYGSAYLANATYATAELSKVVGRCSQANGLEARSRSKSGAFSGTGGLPSSADSYSWDAAVLGAELSWTTYAMPAFRLAFDLMEFRFWASRASDTDFTQLQNYLDNKFGSA